MSIRVKIFVKNKSNMPIKISNMLRIKNGKIVCKDGRNLKKYLMKMVSKHGVTDKTPFVLIHRDHLIDIMRSAGFII